ncbi:MAG: glycosyltransferase [Bacteroidetes bacterium]|nr:glycosyltransferase [Bacteroidota bacterium]
MKKIVFTVINDLTYDQRMNRICGSLASAGYHVLLVGRKLEKSLPLQEKTFQQKRLKCLFNKGKLFYVEYNLRLFFFLFFYRADIYSAVDLDTIMPNLFAAKIKGKKLVYDAHEYFTEVPEVVHRPMVKKVWEWVARFAIPNADLCYTASQSIAKEFADIYHKSFDVIRNVPLLKEEIHEENEEHFILYQGALNMGRGLEQLIITMKEIPLKLVLAGEGDLSKKLRVLVKKNHLDDKVKFVGYVKPEELKALTQKAFIGYNLLENLGKSYYFSLANKFFDYMHAGVPSLCNNFPEYVAINTKYEVSVLTELNKESIVKAVIKLTEDKNLYQTLSKNCKLAALEFNWQREEKTLIQLYYDL